MELRPWRRVGLLACGAIFRRGRSSCHEEGTVAVPDVLTLEEAARVRRIGRSAAYELAGRFLASGGSDGIPVVRVGRLLRVPRAALEQFMGGPISDIPATTARTSTSRQKPTKGNRRHLVLADDPRLPLP